MSPHLPPLLLIAVIAVLAPLVSALPIGIRLPIVVSEILLGIAVGPHGLGLIADDGIVAFLGDLGLAMLFFLAGMELDLAALRGRPLAMGACGWLLSVGLALATVGLLWRAGFVRAPVLVGLALTTTAVGTLLPILRDTGELRTSLGPHILAAGAMGEFGPIMLMSVVVAHDSPRWQQTLLLAVFVALAGLAAWSALRLRPPGFVSLLKRTMHSSSQLPVRFALLILMVLAAMAQTFGLDMVLGAFSAGMIVGLAVHGEAAGPLRHKLEALGFGFLVPIFFVSTGVKFDLGALLADGAAVLRVPVFLALFLAIRGLPALLYRNEVGPRDRWILALYSATGLPLVVALTEIGVSTGRMRSDNAAALVGAGMLSVLLFPLAATILRSRSGRHAREPRATRR